MTEFREGLIDDVYAARVEIDNLDRQLKRMIAAIKSCEELQTANDSNKDLETAGMLYGHYALIQTFVNSCNAMRGTLEWLTTDLGIVDRLARGELGANGK